MENRAVRTPPPHTHLRAPPRDACLLESGKAILDLSCPPVKKHPGSRGVKAGPGSRAAIPYTVFINSLSCCLAFHVTPEPFFFNRCMLSKHSFVSVFHPLPSLLVQTVAGSCPKRLLLELQPTSSTHRSRVSRVRQCVCNSHRQGRNCNCS